MAKKTKSPLSEGKEKIIRILEWTGAILFVLLAIFMGIAGISSLLGVGATSIDMSQYVMIHYTGFNEKGEAELTVDKAGIEKAIKAEYAKYEAGFFPIFKTNTLDDYLEFAYNIEAEIDKADNLKNGDVINITTKFNEDIAKKLHASLSNTEIEVAVEDLKDGRYIDNEELFKDLQFSVSGVSPVIEVSISNASKDDFISKVKFNIVDEKACYANGDSIKIEAVVDEAIAIAENIDIDAGTHIKEYKIDGFKSYINGVDQVPQEVLAEAIEQGKTYFGDALEYGLRIFTEANLYPDFSKGYEFSDPEIISAYVETITDPANTSEAKPYNYLELCYNVYLSQPKGKGCMAEAIVCFSNLTVDENGKCVVDYSTGKLFSASHNDSSIKKSLSEWFGKDYNVEKFEMLP